MDRRTTRRNRPSQAQAVPGATWFGAMVSVWSIFFTLLVVSPETLADAYDWLRGLGPILEVLMWIVTLPWAVAWLAWEASWEHWVRVLVVALLCAVHLVISMPRAR
ncbi:MAG: hypothetical protein R6W48_00580 [Gaiellaceae bacterium]